MKEVESRVTRYGESCIICGKPKQHTHHLICGTSGRSFADKFGLVIPLCAKCHEELHKSGIAMDFSKMLGQAIWEKNYYMDLYNNLNETKIDEARDRFRTLNTSGSYM